jgi:hypothetical protein
MFRFISLLFAFTVLMSAALGVTSSNIAQAGKRDGVVTLESRYSVSETVKRIKADVSEKGIMLFDDIDQAKLGNAAGNKVRPSRLILFGNPWAPPSSPPTRLPVWTGRCVFSFMRRRTVR